MGGTVKERYGQVSEENELLGHLFGSFSLSGLIVRQVTKGTSLYPLSVH